MTSSSWSDGREIGASAPGRDDELRGRHSRPAGRRPGVVSAVVALAAVGLAGCGGVSEQRVGDDDLRFFVHGRDLRPPDAVMAADVVGVLAVADGCVLLDRDGHRYPVVWPHGTSVVGTDPLVLELPSGEQLELGEEVSGGGGYISREHAGTEVPDECLDEDREVAFFNLAGDPVTAG